MDSSQHIRIAIDAMGGDHAPQVIVAGTASAVGENPHISPVLVGDERELSPLLGRYRELEAASIVHTPDKVDGDEKPSVALRKGKRSSMRLAIEMIREGKADAMVSAGNSGALMGMALMVLRTIEGIDRPALAAYFPSLKGQCCMLDLGANVDCSAANLVQFAAMGDAFCRIICDIDKPSIGLLNIGEEEQKGNPELREAAAILADPSIGLSYHGFIEGNDILMGGVDVAVCDGFSGNVALKTAEGTAKLVSVLIRQSFQKSLLARLGYLLASKSMRQFQDAINPQYYNGAVLLGLNGIVVKSHGNASAKGFANAIKVAANMHSGRFMDDLHRNIGRSLQAIAMAAEAKDAETGDAETRDTETGDAAISDNDDPAPVSNPVEAGDKPHG